MTDVNSSYPQSHPQSSIHDSLPLDYQRQEVRLLKIISGQTSEPVRLQIFKARLDENPEYSALSYAWSDEGLDVTIQVGDQKMTVSETLHLALVHLRQPNTDKVFWIDAICINQTSIREKNHQVPLMDKIYSSAQDVIIWLGDATEDTEQVIKFINYIAENFTAGSESTGPSQVEEYLQNRVSWDTLRVGLIALFQKRWFYRTWILQEAALPVREPKFLCGPDLLPWSSLVGLFHYMSEFLRDHLNERFCAIHSPNAHEDALRSSFYNWPFQDLHYLRKEIQRMRPCGPPLDGLIFMTRTASASDPRDRIYGLLGLTCQGHGHQIQVDYGKPITEVFRDAMVDLFLEKKGLASLTIKEMELLDHRYLEDGHPSDFNPASVSGASWIPDFSKTFLAVRQLEMSTEASPFEAGLGIMVHPRIESFSLHARGILVDVVERTKAANSSRRGQDDIDWTELLPLFNFLRTHARVSSHSEKANGRINCASCVPAQSHIESIVALAKEFQRHEAGRHYGEEGNERLERSDLAQPVAAKPPSDDQLSPDNYASHQEDVSGLCEAIEKLSPPRSDSKVEAAGPDFQGEYPGLTTLECRFLAAGQQAMSLFHKCGLYQPPIGEAPDFWVAACQTLIAGQWIRRDEQRPNPPEEDIIRFALHWEAFTRDLRSSHADGNSESAASMADNNVRDPGRLIGLLRDQHRASRGISKAISELWQTTLHRLILRKAFVTKNRWMGLGPSVTQPGDVVAILFGGKVPYILRPVDDHYLFVGECYVHGIMYGELVSECQGDKVDKTPEGDSSCGYAAPKEFEIR
ncbi:hypothetical protein ACJ41O_013080 [Fusarium nematophilum]